MSAINGAFDNQVQMDLNEDAVGLDTKLVDFASDKTKVFFEALANISFYFSKIPGFNQAGWSNSEKQFGVIKTAISMPSFFKGTSSLVKNYNDGKLTFKKGYADFAFVVSDGIDTIKTFQNFGVVALSDVFKATLDKVKTLAGLVGLTKSIEDGYSDISRLKNMNPQNVVVADPKNKAQAVELKRRWIAAELRSKEYDMLKNITGYALCVLSMTVGFEPWKFAILGSVGLVGKFMNYYHKVDATTLESKFINATY